MQQELVKNARISESQNARYQRNCASLSGLVNKDTDILMSLLNEDTITLPDDHVDGETTVGEVEDPLGLFEVGLGATRGDSAGGGVGGGAGGAGVDVAPWVAMTEGEDAFMEEDDEDAYQEAHVPVNEF